MCQRIGLPPTETMGFGIEWVNSDKRVPNPPAKITTFMSKYRGQCPNNRQKSKDQKKDSGRQPKAKESGLGAVDQEKKKETR